MIKFLAFILILCVLFGVEATRSFIFGTFGFIFWVIVILAAIGLVIDYVEKHNTPEKKEAREKAKEKSKGENDSVAWIILGVFLVVVGVIIAIASK